MVALSRLEASICFAVLMTASVFAGPADEEKLAFFESRIRPVLVEHCYACHNSTDNAEGGLAVDHREAMAAGGDGGKLLASQEGSNRLIAILKHEIDGLEMPQDGPKLDDRVIEDFEKWITDGAFDPRDKPPSPDTLKEATSWQATLQRRKAWWSFQPIKSTQPPATSNWSDHPVDRFIADRWKQHDLQPVGQADPPVLIRRLFITLIGLPPTPEQFDQWIAKYERSQNRDDVTRQLIDDLLASEHFGERWARHWMDWIRYAESHGSEGDPGIEGAWRYRDYLIRALNRDVPYDQLVREHVAGDLLEDPRIDRALGWNESIHGPIHWRMVFHGFAPTDALDEKVRFVDDQVNAFSKAFLGLTVSCARCHDHKFDAISQRDYYALFGIFAACRPARQTIDLPDAFASQLDKLKALKPQIRKAIASDWLTSFDKLEQRLVDDGDWLEAAKDKQHSLHPLHQVRQRIKDDKSFDKQWRAMADHWRSQATIDADHLIHDWKLSEAGETSRWYKHGLGLSAAFNPAGEYRVATQEERALEGIYPAGVYSHALSDKLPGRLTSEDIDVPENAELWVRAIGDRDAFLRYVVQDYPRNGTVFPVTQLKPQWRWQRYDLKYWTGDRLHVELTTGLDAPLLVKNQPRSWFGATEVRLQTKGGAPPRSLHPLAHLLAPSSPASIDEVTQLVAATTKSAIEAWRDGKSSDSQAELLDRCVRDGLLPNELSRLPSAREFVRSYRKIEATVPVATRVPGLDETQGRKQPLFVRGNHKKPSEIVPARFLEAIDESEYDPSRSSRLQLAEDLLRDDNPLTRRVIANRLWHHLFGKGIVATPDNLGRLGMKPTHPELLDWLAGEVEKRDWSLKEMIRLIVTSKTWQLDSTPNSHAMETDPSNNFLARANVRRMDAEVIRDSLLAVSGRLDRNVFGPPVSGQSPRRSVYVRVIRNSLDPFLRAFDFPEPFSATGRRDVTNVPAQSLMMMNDPRVASDAAQFARKVLESTDSTEQRVNQLFVSAFSRRASDAEIESVQAFFDSTLASRKKLIAKAERLDQQIASATEQASSILRPVREQLVATAQADVSDDANGPSLKPIAHWDFSKGLEDLVGKANVKLQGGAKLDGGALSVRQGGYVVTDPLEFDLSEKTLEAWVQLDRLDQRSGGVMTLQTRDGVVFDSIVFAEQRPRQWLAGSNNFARTEPFSGSEESDAVDRFVHVAISYHADGQVTGFRDGRPYGKPYKSRGLQNYQAGNAVVSFGVRHLPAGGNRLLSGRVLKANLYDRALSAEEIASSARGGGVFVSNKQVMDALSDAQRDEHRKLLREIDALQTRRSALGEVPKSMNESDLWIELARAMITFKEFVYVR